MGSGSFSGVNISFGGGLNLQAWYVTGGQLLHVTNYSATLPTFCNHCSHIVQQAFTTFVPALMINFLLTKLRTWRNVIILFVSYSDCDCYWQCYSFDLLVWLSNSHVMSCVCQLILQNKVSEMNEWLSCHINVNLYLWYVNQQTVIIMGCWWRAKVFVTTIFGYHPNRRTSLFLGGHQKVIFPKADYDILRN